MPASSIDTQTALGNASVDNDIKPFQTSLHAAPDTGATTQRVSDVQSQTRVLTRHLDRLFDLEEVDEYLQFVVTVHPQLSEQVAGLKAEHNEFRSLINALIARLNTLEADDQPRFAAICLEIHEVTCRVLAHGRAEGKLLSQALNRDEGNEG